MNTMEDTCEASDGARIGLGGCNPLHSLTSGTMKKKWYMDLKINFKPVWYKNIVVLVDLVHVLHDLKVKINK